MTEFSFCRYLRGTWQRVLSSPALVSPVLTHHEEFALVDSDPINYFWNDIGQALPWGRNDNSGFCLYCFCPGFLRSFTHVCHGLLLCTRKSQCLPVLFDLAGTPPTHCTYRLARPFLMPPPLVFRALTCLLPCLGSECPPRQPP